MERTSNSEATWQAGWRVLIFLFWSTFINPIVCSRTNQNRLLVGFQAPRNLSYPFSALKLGSAVQIAIDKINSNPSFVENYTLDFVYVDTDCKAKLSLGAFIDQIQKENISALFGPPCPEEAEVGFLFLCVLFLIDQLRDFLTILYVMFCSYALGHWTSCIHLEHPNVWLFWADQQNG